MYGFTIIAGCGAFDEGTLVTLIVYSPPPCWVYVIDGIIHDDTVKETVSISSFSKEEVQKKAAEEG